jgi:glycosyltransferase involved in cell wall biosynthesis
MKICVYAICRNEEEFVDRFMDSAKDADLIQIADTGSTDGTCDAIENWALTHNTKVQLNHIWIKPWRFDLARNAGLALVPTDIDVCFSVDLDEVLQPGWREEIERLWVPGQTTRMEYMYDWGLDHVFNYQKIICRHGYYHIHPCHEYERPDGRLVESWVHSPKLLVKHMPKAGAGCRTDYITMLKISTEEDPICSRNAFYYGRELMFHGKWEESIKELDRYLNMPNSIWLYERGFAHLCKAKCYIGLGDKGKAYACNFDAAKEIPHAREPWCALAQLCFQEDWNQMFAYAMRAVSITQREWHYCVDPEVWESLPHSLACVAAWNVGLKDIAREQGRIAVTKKPSGFCDAEANLKSMGGQ